MFLGLAIGDALGKPVEMFKREKIANLHGRVTSYLPCDGHKFFDGHPIGSITDDTILSMAVAEALIEDHLSMEVQARRHAEALEHAMGGWGNTTKEALRRLKKGVSWEESGKSDRPMRGTGNGVAMKIIPYGAYCAALKIEVRNSFLEDLSLMTHYTHLGVSSGYVMATAAKHAFMWGGLLPEPRHMKALVDAMVAAAIGGVQRKGDPSEESLADNIHKLYGYDNMNPESIGEMFGNGSCYIMHSVPFTLAYWMRNPASVEVIYDLASAGGDTDSNASMAGGLVGAMSGDGVFPTELVNGLGCRDEVLDLAERFCDKFGVEN